MKSLPNDAPNESPKMQEQDAGRNEMKSPVDKSGYERLPSPLRL